MNDYKSSIQSVISRLDEKKVKKFKLEVFINLVEKVKDVEDPELVRQIESLLKLLNDFEKLKGFYKKHYFKQFQALKSYVRKNFGFLAKGDLLNEHTALGIGIGVALGALLMSVNSGFIAIGIALGAGIGISTGNSKEKSEEEKGNLY